ncbi:MAG: hypothetical protein N2Z22_03740 [Turneriella sp.]|nr:hypothetical protein [Turneriella sp.]
MRAALLFAPAKINLGLAVTGRYRDGYHHLETVLLPISLYDRIECLAGETQIEHRWHFSRDPIIRRSLALGVVQNPLLKKCLDLCQKKLHIIVHKNIPSPAGLGGASSDAAVLLAYLWQLQQPTSVGKGQLVQAFALGADIPFFLQHGLWGEPALLCGAGFHLSRFNLPHLKGFLAIPQFGFSTKKMFAYFQNQKLPTLAENSTDLAKASTSKTALRQHEIPVSDEICPGVYRLRNDFEQAASVVYPAEAAMLEKALRQLASFVQRLSRGPWWLGMSGSGPALYAATTETTSGWWQQSPATTRVIGKRLGKNWSVRRFQTHSLQWAVAKW